MIHNSKIETAQQASAAKDEEHRLLCEAMNHYSKSTIEQAVNLLRSDDLYRSEKVLGCAEWLMKIRREIEATNTQHRTNLLWRYAATAPTGYCHVRSGMIGTLLDDIAAGMSITAVKARFADKMNPMKYQRPTAAPSATNVRMAEKLIEDLGLTESLKRRFARIDEIEKVWAPVNKASETRRNGVFSSVITKEDRASAPSGVMTPGITMTWEKFMAGAAARSASPMCSSRRTWSGPWTCWPWASGPITQDKASRYAKNLLLRVGPRAGSQQL